MKKAPISAEQKQQARQFMIEQLKRTPTEQVAAAKKQLKLNRSTKKNVK